MASFNPRPLTSGRRFPNIVRRLSTSFNPRPLTSGRHQATPNPKVNQWFQSTPAHERATPIRKESGFLCEVSIHARSRAGDLSSWQKRQGGKSFNPRPLTSGRRQLPRFYICRQWFQSTPAHERATSSRRLLRSRLRCFNPRPLTSGRRLNSNPPIGGLWFQSTPAHERATRWQFQCPSTQRFQSTPAHERATCPHLSRPSRGLVSIHARSRAGDIHQGITR